MDTENENEKLSFFKELLSLIKIIIISIIIIVPFKYFIVEPFIVSGSSMSPNYETGEYLFVNKLAGTVGAIERGDILVFVPPSERSDHWLKYTGYFDPRKKYIKRVIGLPGETVKLENHKIFIKKVGEDNFIELNEPYIKNNGTNIDKITILKSDEYFMLGDNRGNSYDSEEWGPIKESDIMGSPFFRLLPFNKISVNPESYNFRN